MELEGARNDFNVSWSIIEHCTIMAVVPFTVVNTV